MEEKQMEFDAEFASVHSENDRRNMIMMACGVVALGVVSWILLGNEALIVIKWWLVMLVMGVGILPLSQKVMAPMTDKGYFVGKMIGLAVSGYVTWLLCYAGIPFTGITSVILTILTFAAVWGGFFLVLRRKGGLKSVAAKLPVYRIYGEEMLFLAMMIFWAYLVGFKPEAFGTEKMMDYGFVASLMKSTSIPATDMWYSDGIINYYYGGQYYTAFLGKLTFTNVHYVYNLMRVLIAAAAFVVTFSIATSLLARSGFGKKTAKDGIIRNLGGTLSGLALVFAGNMHYVILGKLVPMVQEMLGMEDIYSYWFPDATRYIGYRPDVADKTIHEFPCYSFILGDLHAHMINIIFVLPMIALLFSWVYTAKKDEWTEVRDVKVLELIRHICDPAIIVMTLLIAIYQFTNYWDYPIYFGLAGLVILFTNIRKYKKNWQMTAFTTIGQAAVALGLGAILIMPFTKDFASIFSGIGLTDRHTRFYQLMVLWGLPVITTLVYMIANARVFILKKHKEGLSWYAMPSVDMFVTILGIWAIVLLLVPEVMYVRDIYGTDYQRSNTMFKFTYQAYMMLAISTGYAIMRLMTWKGDGRRGLFKVGIVSLILTLWTCGYFGKAVKSWFGDVLDVSGYQTLDATAFIEEDYPANAEAIRWVEDNTEAGQVVLEANGNSYTSAAMCSAMTGNPTILGWYTHEWLWRNDTDDLNERVADIQTIYTSSDVTAVKNLLEQYHVEYIFVGSEEWTKYGTVNLDTLNQVGTVCFEGTVENDAGQVTRIYKVN